jgi:hypothetical protein
LWKIFEQHKQIILQSALVFETPLLAEKLTSTQWGLSDIIRSLLSTLEVDESIDKEFVDHWMDQLSYIIVLCFVGFALLETRSSFDNSENSNYEKSSWTLHSRDYLIRYHPGKQKK